MQEIDRVAYLSDIHKLFASARTLTGHAKTIPNSADFSEGVRTNPVEAFGAFMAMAQTIDTLTEKVQIMADEYIDALDEIEKLKKEKE